MVRARQAFVRKLAAGTAGLADCSTGKATATVTATQGEPLPAPALTDGVTGPGATAVIPDGQAAVLDLGAARALRAIAFSRDRTALRVDSPVAGYALEVSVDGRDWQMVRDSAKSGAPAPGEFLAFPVVKARFVRLRVWGAYSGPVQLDEVTVSGE